MPKTDSFRDMLFALTDLKNNYGGTPAELSKQFFEALAKFGPEYLVGSFSMVTNKTTGEVTISYHP